VVADAHPKSLGDFVLGIYLRDRNAISREVLFTTF
jgi:hypothetical protein